MPNSVARGRFITLEGGEGGGKSTQAGRLATALAARGVDVVQTREPGGSPDAEDIRRLLVEGEPGRWLPLSEALLHSAARADHIAKLIEPALAAGRWVVCDRFADSTLAYQGYGHGLAIDAVETLNDLTTGTTWPDLTLILDLPVTEGLARAGARAENGDGPREDRYERMDAAFHERLRRGYLAIAAAAPERCVVIDARQSIEEVGRQILDAVGERLGLP